MPSSEDMKLTRSFALLLASALAALVQVSVRFALFLDGDTDCLYRSQLTTGHSARALPSILPRPERRRWSAKASAGEVCVAH